jgi:Uma2 family endonuclease
MTTASSPFERRMSVAEFLAWSEDLADEIRYELVAGVPVRLMAPPTIRHARIQANVSAALRQALAAAGAPCQVFPMVAWA